MQNEQNATNYPDYQGADYEEEVSDRILKSIEEEILSETKYLSLKEVKEISKRFDEAKQMLAYDLSINKFFSTERELKISEIANILESEDDNLTENEKRFIKLCFKRGKVDDFSRVLDLLDKICDTEEEKSQIINGIYIQNIRVDSAFGANKRNIKKFNFSKKKKFIEVCGRYLDVKYIQEVCESEPNSFLRNQLAYVAIMQQTGEWIGDTELCKKIKELSSNGDDYIQTDNIDKVIKECGKEGDNNFKNKVLDCKNANNEDRESNKNKCFCYFNKNDIEELEKIISNKNYYDKNTIEDQVKQIQLDKIKYFFIYRVFKQFKEGLITQSTWAIETKRIMKLEFENINIEVLNMVSHDKSINDPEKLEDIFTKSGERDNIFFPTNPPFYSQPMEVKDVLFLKQNNNEMDDENEKKITTIKDIIKISKSNEYKEIKFVAVKGLDKKVLFEETEENNTKGITIYFDIYNKINKDDLLSGLLKNKNLCKKISKKSVRSVYDFSQMLLNTEQMTEKTDTYENVILANLTRNRCNSISGFEIIDKNVVNTGLNGKGNSVGRVDLSDKVIFCSAALQILKSIALSNNPIHEIEISIDDLESLPEMLKEYNNFLTDKIGSKLVPLRLRINSKEKLSSAQVEKFKREIKSLEEQRKIDFQSVVINNISLCNDKALESGIVISCNETYQRAHKKKENNISNKNQNKNEISTSIDVESIKNSNTKSSDIKPSIEQNTKILEKDLINLIGSQDAKSSLQSNATGGSEVEADTQLENQQENQQDRDVTALMNLYRKPELLEGYSDDDIITKQNCVSQMKKLLSKNNNRLSQETKDFLLKFVKGSYTKFNEIFDKIDPNYKYFPHEIKGSRIYPYGFTPEAFVASIANFLKCGHAMNCLGVGDQRFSVKKMDDGRCVLHFSSNMVDITPDNILSMISPLSYDVNTVSDKNGNVKNCNQTCDSILSTVERAIGKQSVDKFRKPIEACHGEKNLIDNEDIINNAVKLIMQNSDTRDIFKEIATLYLSQIKKTSVCGYNVIPTFDLTKFMMGYSSFCNIINEYIEDGFFTAEEFKKTISLIRNDISANVDVLNTLRNIFLVEKIKAIRSVILNKIYKNNYNDGDIDIYDDKEILNYFKKHKQDFTEEDKTIMKNEFSQFSRTSGAPPIDKMNSLLLEIFKNFTNGFASLGLINSQIFFRQNINNNDSNDVIKINTDSNNDTVKLFYQFSQKREILPDGRFSENENLTPYWISLIRCSYDLYNLLLGKAKDLNPDDLATFRTEAIEPFCKTLNDNTGTEKITFEELKILFNKITQYKGQPILQNILKLKISLNEKIKILSNDNLAKSIENIMTANPPKLHFIDDDLEAFIKLLNFDNDAGINDSCDIINKADNFLKTEKNVINHKYYEPHFSEQGKVIDGNNCKYWAKILYLKAIEDKVNDNDLKLIIDRVVKNKEVVFSKITSLTKIEEQKIDKFLLGHLKQPKKFTVDFIRYNELKYNNKYYVSIEDITTTKNNVLGMAFCRDTEDNFSYRLLTNYESKFLTDDQIEKKLTLCRECIKNITEDSKYIKIIKLLNDICIKHNNKLDSVLNILRIIDDDKKIDFLKSLQKYALINGNFPCKLSEFLELFNFKNSLQENKNITNEDIISFKKIFSINNLTINNKLFIMKNNILDNNKFSSEQFRKNLDQLILLDQVHSDIKKIKGSEKIIFADNTIQLILNSIIEEKTKDIIEFCDTYKKLNDLYLKNVKNEVVKNNILTLSSLISGKLDDNGGFGIEDILRVSDILLYNITDENFTLCANYLFEKIDDMISYKDASGIATILGSSMLNSGIKHAELSKMAEKKKKEQEEKLKKTTEIEKVANNILEEHKKILNTNVEKEDQRVFSAIKKPIKKIATAFKRYINDNITDDEITIENLVRDYTKCFTLKSLLLSEDSLNLISQMTEILGNNSAHDNEHRLIKRTLEFINSLVTIYSGNLELCNKDFEMLYKKSKTEKLTETERIKLQATYSVKNIQMSGKAFRQEQMATSILTQVLKIDKNCFTKIPTGGGKTMSITHDVFNQLSNNKIPFVVTTNQILVDEMVREMKNAYKPGKDNIYVFDANHNLVNVATQKVITDLDKEYEILNGKESAIIATAAQLNFYVDKRMLYGQAGIKIRELIKKDGVAIVDEFDNNLDANSNNVISLTIKDQGRYDFLKYIYKCKNNIQNILTQENKSIGEIKSCMGKLFKFIVQNIKSDFDKTNTDECKQALSAINFIKKQIGEEFALNPGSINDKTKSLFSNSISQFIKAIKMDKGRDFVIDNDKDGNKIYRPIIAGVPADFGSKFNDQVDTLLKMRLKDEEGVNFEELDKASKSINGGTNLLMCDAFSQVHGYSGSIGNREIQDKLWKKMGFSVINLLPTNPKNVITKYSKIIEKDTGAIDKNKEGQASDRIIEEYTLFALCIAIKNSKEYKDKNYNELTSEDKKKIYSKAYKMVYGDDNVPAGKLNEEIVPNFSTYGFILGKDVRVEQDLFKKVKENIDKIFDKHISVKNDLDINNDIGDIKKPKFANLTSLEKNINLKEYDMIIKDKKFDNNYIIFSTAESFRGVDLKKSPYVSTYETSLTEEERIQANGRTGRSDRVGMTYTVIETNKEEIKSCNIGGLTDVPSLEGADYNKKQEFITKISEKNSQIELEKFLVKKKKCEIKNEAFVKATYLMNKLLVDADGKDLQKKYIDDIQNTVFNILDEYQSYINKSFEDINNENAANTKKEEISKDIDEYLLQKIAHDCKFDKRKHNFISSYIAEAINFYKKVYSQKENNNLQLNNENEKLTKNEKDRVEEINKKKFLKTHYIDGDRNIKFRIQSNIKQDGFTTFNAIGSLFDCGFNDIKNIKSISSGYNKSDIFFYKREEKKIKKDKGKTNDEQCFKASLKSNIFFGTKKLLANNNKLITKSIIVHDLRNVANGIEKEQQEYINKQKEYLDKDNTIIITIKDNLVLLNGKHDVYDKFKQICTVNNLKGNEDKEIIQNFFISSVIKIISSSVNNNIDNAKILGCATDFFNIEKQRIDNQLEQQTISSGEDQSGKIKEFYTANLIKQKLYGNIKLAFQNKNNLSSLFREDQVNDTEVINTIENKNEDCNCCNTNNSNFVYDNQNNSKEQELLNNINKSIEELQSMFDNFGEICQKEIIDKLSNTNDIANIIKNNIKKLLEQKRQTLSKIMLSEGKIPYEKISLFMNEIKKMNLDNEYIESIMKNVAYIIRQEQCKFNYDNEHELKLIDKYSNENGEYILEDEEEEKEIFKVLKFNDGDNNKKKLQWSNVESKKISECKTIQPDEGFTSKDLLRKISDRTYNIEDNIQFLNKQQRDFEMFKNEYDDFCKKVLEQRKYIFPDISNGTETAYRVALEETNSIFLKKINNIQSQKDISKDNKDLMTAYLCDNYKDSLIKQVFFSYQTLFNSFSLNMPEGSSWKQEMGNAIDSDPEFNEDEKTTAKEIFSVYIEVFGEKFAKKEKIDFDEENEENKKFIEDIKIKMLNHLKLRKIEGNKIEEVKSTEEFLEKYVNFFVRRIQREKDRKNDLIHKITNDVKNTLLFEQDSENFFENLQEIGIKNFDVEDFANKENLVSALSKLSIQDLEKISKELNNVKARNLDLDFYNFEEKQKEIDSKILEKIGIVLLTILTVGLVHCFKSFQEYRDEVFNKGNNNSEELKARIERCNEEMKKNPHNVNISLDKIYSVQELHANVKEMDEKDKNNNIPDKNLYQVNTEQEEVTR